MNKPVVYHWLNHATGEIVENFRDVLRTGWIDAIKYHVFPMWTYSRKGY